MNQTRDKLSSHYAKLITHLNKASRHLDKCLHTSVSDNVLNEPEWADEMHEVLQALNEVQSKLDTTINACNNVPL